MKRLPQKCGYIMAITAIIIMLAGYLPAASQDNPLTGDYFGSVAVNSPSGLGNIDLAFQLKVGTGGAIDAASSYILLDKTILFPKSSTQVNGKDVGPKVLSGTFTSTAFSLMTQPFTSMANGRTVNRQIVLGNSTVKEQGNSITGTYTETITGYLPQPMTIIGSFVLVRPVTLDLSYACCIDSMAPFGELSIEEIRAGGKNPSVVEFEDVSCAMYHYRNAIAPTVSETVMKQAIAEYQNYLISQ